MMLMHGITGKSVYKFLCQYGSWHPVIGEIKKRK